MTASRRRPCRPRRTLPPQRAAHRLDRLHAWPTIRFHTEESLSGTPLTTTADREVATHTRLSAMRWPASAPFSCFTNSCRSSTAASSFPSHDDPLGGGGHEAIGHDEARPTSLVDLAGQGTSPLRLTIGGTGLRSSSLNPTSSVVDSAASRSSTVTGRVVDRCERPEVEQSQR